MKICPIDTTIRNAAEFVLVVKNLTLYKFQASKEAPTKEKVQEIIHSIPFCYVTVNVRNEFLTKHMRVVMDESKEILVEFVNLGDGIYRADFDQIVDLG